MDSLHLNIQNYKFGFLIETRVDLLVKIKVYRALNGVRSVALHRHGNKDFVEI
jgi:hypothetical protein